MTQFLRALSGAILVVVLALTSLTMATARGQARMAEQVVICSGYGMVTIALDPEGRPAGPLQICPDCTLSLFVADGVAVPVSGFAAGQGRRQDHPALVGLVPGQRPAALRARGPPAVA